MEALAVISPFHYYQVPAILAGSVAAAGDLSVLCSLAIVCTVAAYWRFSARDV
jgi:hypothetical protein